MTPEERNALKEALIEEKSSLDAGKQSVFDVVTTHGFSEQLIKSITENCQHIFTIDYLMENFPIFNFQHAVTILEYIREVFEDVPAITELVSIVSRLLLIYLTMKVVEIFSLKIKTGLMIRN